MARKPSIVLLDIETLPNEVLSWGLRVDGYLSHDNILAERTILCAAWKYLDSKKVHFIRAKGGSDKNVVKKLHKVLSKADAVVAHHGDAFDIPWVKARAVYYGLPPIPNSLIQIDTKKIAKKEFFFNSNRLDYLGQYLKLGKKIKTEFDLWKDCMAGDPVALRKMEKYNRADVLLLEKVYYKLRPYTSAKFNLALFGDKERACPTCGEEKLQSRGYGQTRTRKYRRFCCGGCGAWSHKPLKKTGVVR